MRQITLYILLLLAPITAIATIQAPDVIIVKGKRCYLHSNPLDYYFAKHNISIKDFQTIISSALWRGYIATFELENDSVFVKDVEILSDMDSTTKTKSIYNEVFPDHKKFFLNTWSETLVMFNGKLIPLSLMANKRTYDTYTILEIQNGVLIKQQELTDDQYIKFRDQRSEKKP